MTRFVWRAVEREVLVAARTWRAQAFTALVQPALFLLAMGVGLGGLVDEGAMPATSSLDGADYLEFVAPGLLAASAMLTVAGDGLWGVMAGIKWMGHFKGMVATSMTPGDVYGGLVLSRAVRAFVVAVPFLAVAALLGAIRSWWAPLALVAATLLAMAAMAWLSAYSVTRDRDSSFPLVMRLGIMPLFLFSGTFFPVSQLPDVLEPLAWLSPLWHGAEAARAATLGTVDAGTVGHLLVLVAVVAAAIPVGIRNFTRQLTP